MNSLGQHRPAYIPVKTKRGWSVVETQNGKSIIAGASEETARERAKAMTNKANAENDGLPFGVTK